MLGLTLPAAFDRRLRREAGRPLAVGFSGGGDSLATLILTKAWADRAGRPVVALTVDHGLNPASADWTRRCAETAARLGAGFQALRWEGEKPSSGLPAAARAARHALLAEAAREAGAAVVVLGHTASDLAEAAAMRAEGSTVPDPHEWAPSPAWPQGRGVFLLRPLLGLTRQTLRQWLAGRGETWIDDPANDDLRFARARARGGVDRGHDKPDGTARDERDIDPDEPDWSVTFRDSGEALVTGLPNRHALAAALACAAGTTRPSRGARLDRLRARLAAGEAFAATLAGARIVADGQGAMICREAGEFARRPAAPVPLSPGRPAIWDGRFEIVAARPGLVAVPLAGRAAGLPPLQRKALAALPAAVRPTLPALEAPDGSVTCPILAEGPEARAVPLARARFEAACGFVNSEPAANEPARVAKDVRAS